MRERCTNSYFSWFILDCLRASDTHGSFRRRRWLKSTATLLPSAKQLRGITLNQRGFSNGLNTCRVVGVCQLATRFLPEISERPLPHLYISKANRAAQHVWCLVVSHKPLITSKEHFPIIVEYLQEIFYFIAYIISEHLCLPRERIHPAWCLQTLQNGPRWDQTNTWSSPESSEGLCSLNLTSELGREGSWQPWTGINRPAASGQTHHYARLTSVIIPGGLITCERRKIRVLIQMFSHSAFPVYFYSVYLLK